MQQGSTPTITTAELRRRLLAGSTLWLLYAPDDAAFAAAHIPGSLGASEDVPAALYGGAPVVVYGEGPAATRAHRLAAALHDAGAAVRWYPGGLRAWRQAGLPIDGAG